MTDPSVSGPTRLALLTSPCEADSGVYRQGSSVRMGWGSRKSGHPVVKLSYVSKCGSLAKWWQKPQIYKGCFKRSRRSLSIVLPLRTLLFLPDRPFSFSIRRFMHVFVQISLISNCFFHNIFPYIPTSVFHTLHRSEKVRTVTLVPESRTISIYNFLDPLLTLSIWFCP